MWSLCAFVLNIVMWNSSISLLFSLSMLHPGKIPVLNQSIFFPFLYPLWINKQRWRKTILFCKLEVLQAQNLWAQLSLLYSVPLLWVFLPCFLSRIRNHPKWLFQNFSMGFSIYYPPSFSPTTVENTSLLVWDVDHPALPLLHISSTSALQVLWLDGFTAFSPIFSTPSTVFSFCSFHVTMKHT